MSIKKFCDERTIKTEVCNSPVIECGEKVIIDKELFIEIIEDANHYTEAFKKITGDLVDLKFKLQSFEDFYKQFNKIVNFADKAQFREKE